MNSLKSLLWMMTLAMTWSVTENNSWAIAERKETEPNLPPAFENGDKLANTTAVESALNNVAIAGDVNGDGTVNIYDLVLVGNQGADANGDGYSKAGDIKDLNAIATNFGNHVAGKFVFEPEIKVVPLQPPIPVDHIDQIPVDPLGPQAAPQAPGSTNFQQIEIPKGRSQAQNVIINGSVIHGESGYVNIDYLRPVVLVISGTSMGTPSTVGGGTRARFEATSGTKQETVTLEYAEDENNVSINAWNIHQTQVDGDSTKTQELRYRQTPCKDGVCVAIEVIETSKSPSGYDSDTILFIGSRIMESTILSTFLGKDGHQHPYISQETYINKDSTKKYTVHYLSNGVISSVDLEKKITIQPRKYDSQSQISDPQIYWKQETIFKLKPIHFTLNGILVKPIESIEFQ